MSHVFYPCPTCKASMKWIQCPDCANGFVKEMKDGKWIGMKDCPTCTASGFPRRGGHLECPNCKATER